MFHRIALICLSLLLIASGTASAVQTGCPASDAGQMTHIMADLDTECDMGMGAMQPAGQDTPPYETACCCPAIIAALPLTATPDTADTIFPASFNTPLNSVLLSLSTVPEPPPPRA